MSVVNGYCSVAELRNHLRDAGTRLDDALLERAILASSEAIENITGRKFWQEAATSQRTYTVSDACTVFVDDISTRTGLVVETGTDGATFPTTWASTNYVLEPRNADVVGAGSVARAHAFWQIVAMNRTFTVDHQRPTLRVTARFGWSAVPSPITEACILMAAKMFKLKDAPFGIAGVNEFGPVRVNRPDPYVAQLLSSYELPGFA